MSTTFTYATRRRSLALAMAGLLVTVASEPVAYALPLPWTAAWNVTCPDPVGNAIGWFGADAPLVNCQISDLLAEKFHARAQAIAEDDTNASATVNFQRPFKLDEGGLYNLFLNARNLGVLRATGTGDKAFVIASVCYNRATGGIVFCIDGVDHAFFGPLTAPPALSRMYDTGRIGGQARVGPGNYILDGFLIVSAGGNGSAQFHTLSPAGFDGEGSYAPIPEPSTVVLMASGIAGYAIRRRRRAVR